MNKTDKKIEEIKHRNFVKIIANVAYGYNGSDPNKPLYKDDGLTYATKTLSENYTPNTEVQKAAEEAVRGYDQYIRDHINDPVDDKTLLETYLQSLDKGDGE